MADESDSIEASDTTLEHAPERAAKFLLGVNSHPRIRSLLATVGYDLAEHQKGWSLVHAFDDAGAPTRATLEANKSASEDESTASSDDAQAVLDSMDEKWFTIASATLEVEYPTQHALLLDGVEASSGPSATAGWSTVAARYRALQGKDAKDAKDAKDSKDAKKSDKGDKKKSAKKDGADEAKSNEAALAALARRGFNDALITQVEGLLVRATALGAASVDAEAAEREEEQRLARRDKARRAVYGWIRQWARITPRVLSRRDWLITLGLAERRKSPAKSGE